MDQPHSTSTLGRLRALIPRRADVTYDEALRIAELQATKLVEALGGPDGLTEQRIAALPRIQVVHEDVGVSGMSHWTGQHWLITLNASDSPARRRFTLLHEFKHIVDHGSAAILYTGSQRATGAEQAEHAADYFAGCALVPKRDLKAAWGGGMQRSRDLAAHFGVSEQAIGVRLSQTKLDAFSDQPSVERCARPVSTPRSTPQQFRPAFSRPRTWKSFA
jgi:hypothetical protein